MATQIPINADIEGRPSPALVSFAPGRLRYVFGFKRHAAVVNRGKLSPDIYIVAANGDRVDGRNCP